MTMVSVSFLMRFASGSALIPFSAAFSALSLASSSSGSSPSESELSVIVSGVCLFGRFFLGFEGPATGGAGDEVSGFVFTTGGASTAMGC